LPQSHPIRESPVAGVPIPIQSNLVSEAAADCREDSARSKPEALWPEMAGLEVQGGVSADAPADTIAGEEAGWSKDPVREIIGDPWQIPAARRALHFAARRRLRRTGPLEIRINPLPIAAAARTLDWACLAEQAEVAEWMTDEQHARRALAATFRWIDGASATLGHAVAEEFRAPELFFALLDEVVSLVMV